ncbi:MAG: hypothetical protein ACYS14_05345, partial [Planctomycetota bacterium]
RGPPRQINGQQVPLRSGSDKVRKKVGYVSFVPDFVLTGSRHADMLTVSSTDPWMEMGACNCRRWYR